MRKQELGAEWPFHRLTAMFALGEAGHSADPGRNGDNGIRLRSALPGRERWEIDAIRGRPQIVARLEELLVVGGAVVAAEANPVTGRLLIRFDEGASSLEIAHHLRRAVSLSLAGAGRPSAGAGAARAEAAGEPREDGLALGLKAAAVLAGGAVVAASLYLGASALATAALVGAGVAAVAVTVKGVRQQQQLLAPALSAPDRPARRHPLTLLAKYAGPYKKQIYFASACSILKKVFDIAPPLIIGLSINLVATHGAGTFSILGLTSLPAQLLAIGGLTLAIFGLESIFEFAHKTMWRRIAQLLQRDLRLDAYARVQSISLARLDDESIGEVAVPLTEQINQIETFVNGGIDGLLQLGTNVVMLVAIFTIVAPNLVWIAALPVPLLLWRTFRFQTAVTPLYEETERQAGILNKQMINNIMGLPTIRSFTAEDHENRRIGRLSQDYLESNQPAIHEYAAFLPTFRLPVLAAFTGIIILGGISVGAGTLAIGKYALMLFLVQRFLFPFAYLGEIIDTYQKAMAAVDRVFELFEMPTGPASGDQPLPLESVRGEILFDHVFFSYSRSGDVLADFSLHIEPGQTVALVGVTGIGKSTIVKILLRFYEFDAGRVLLDGHDIRLLRSRDLRSAISLVSQDLFLFDGTVLENIVYGTFDATREEVAAAARTAEAQEFIDALPQRYDTLIGERGNKLSTGQRQRLCLARALLKLKRARILILDEATSAVDTGTEAAFQESLERISRGRTTIIIAHRLSTVRGADQIFVLGERGHIIEQGRHEELLRRGGFYARLWRVQSDEAALGLEASSVPRPETTVSGGEPGRSLS